MKSNSYRLAFLALLALLAGGIVLAGCSGKEATHPTAAGPQAGTTTAKPHTAAPKPAAAAPLPDSTGIPACDNYLASYVACHRAANIFTPDQVEPRYETMRTNLLRDSQDPAIRPQLSARCTMLATQLKEALHGKSCNASPAASSTAGSH